MSPHTHPMTHQSSAPRLAGTWKLGAGRAITLEPVEDGELKVAHGRIWATYDGPHRGASNDWGDHVAGAGDRLWVRAGQRLVIQSWDRQAASYFTWDPVTVTAPVREISFAGVAQPLRDLRLAMMFGARAAWRLGAALGQLALDVVAPRHRPACPGCANVA